MTNWHSSKMNYDMLSQFPTDTMNLHMNQLWDNSKALSNLYTFPSYEFGSFTPYGGINSNSYLTDPMYSVKQSAWGTPAWNNSLPWLNNNASNLWNNSGNMWGNMGWNGSNSNGGSNDSNLTAEEKGFQRKHNALMSLVKQLKDYEGLTNEEKDELTVAARGTKGTWEEKYDALKEAYDKVDKSTVKEFLAEGGFKLGVSKDIKGNAKDKDSFNNRLLACGYEYEDTAVDKQLDTFYDGIKNLSNEDGTDAGAEGILGGFETGTIDILDFVSSWNNEYKDNKDAKRVIKHIAQYYDKIDDEQSKETAKKKILTPFVNAMIKKANSVKGSLDADSKEKMEKAVDELRKALEETKTGKKDKVNSKLSDAFDTVYLLSRQAAMTKLRNDAKKQYGDIDDEVFNDKLFEDEIIKDLKAEGFSDSDIKDAEVKISEKKKTTKADKKEKDEEDEEDKKAEVKEKDEVDKKEPNGSAQVRQDGSDVKHALYHQQWGGTIGKENSEALASTLKEVSNEEDILNFLDGYYGTSGEYPHEGLMERLDDDTENDIITVDIKLDFLDAVLEKANSLGLSEDKNYTKLASLVKKCKGMSDAKSLDVTYEWRIFCTGTTYGEAIDKQLHALHKKMRAKQVEQEKQK